jgi:hypothetical protein
MVESIRGPISFQAFQKPAVKYNVYTLHYIVAGIALIQKDGIGAVELLNGQRFNCKRRRDEVF